VRWLSEDVLRDLVSCAPGDLLPTLSLMVESEIAVQSTAFLGTSRSAATLSIVSERVGLGHAHNLFVDLRVRN
jgi:hypothetical protein